MSAYVDRGVLMRIRSTKDLGDIVRGQRIAMGLSQKSLAARAGVSRPWLIQVERGKPTAEVGLILRLLHELGVRIDAAYDTSTDEEGLDLDAFLRRLRSHD